MAEKAKANQKKTAAKKGAASSSKRVAVKKGDTITKKT